MTLLHEPFGIMPAQFLGFFRGKILFFIGMQVFFHLPYNMFGVPVILHLKVCRYFCHFVGIAADRAELPFLKPVHVGKSPAPRTSEDMIHNHEVISATLIKIY